MAVRKRAARKAPKVAGPGASGRVHRISNAAKFADMLEKAGDRLPSVYVCAQMRPYFTRMSGEHRFRRVVFAEVDVDEAGELGASAGVKTLPTYQVYLRGEVVSSFSGGQPAQVSQMLAAALAAHGGGGGGLLGRLLLAAGLAAAGAAALLAWRLAGGGAGTSSEAAVAEELRQLRQSLAAAQSKLSSMELSKSGRAQKAALTQRKVVQQLESKRAALERSLQRLQQKKAGGGGGGGARGGRRSGGGARAPRRAAAYWSDEDEDEEEQARRPAVLYSDEEEEEEYGE
eukprot:scaffold10.g2426.t1